MSITLDHSVAKAILFEEAKHAKAGNVTTLAQTWIARVTELGELCPHGKSSTTIAALGTAILAKATNSRVDIFSLLDRGEHTESYSARSLADNVWANNRAALDIDLGANGANPLNNTPFIGKTRIEDISGVRNAEGWKYFLDCMEALRALGSSQEAREALRGFILARSKSVLKTLDVDPKAGDKLTPSALVAAIDKYVAEDSEGGRRAQACTAAMLDATFGHARVIVGVINDPDRHAPLDVSVTEGGGFSIAFEVKDKPIQDSHVYGSIEKTVKNHSLRNLAFVAVSKQQEQRNFDGATQWASSRGVKITVFLDWVSLYAAVKCFAPPTGGVYEGEVFRRVIERGVELGVNQDRLKRFRTLGEVNT